MAGNHTKKNIVVILESDKVMQNLLSQATTFVGVEFYEIPN